MSCYDTQRVVFFFATGGGECFCKKKGGKLFSLTDTHWRTSLRYNVLVELHSESFRPASILEQLPKLPVENSVIDMPAL